MRQLSVLLSVSLVTVLLHGGTVVAASPAPPMQLEEVLSVLRTNRPTGMTEAEFNDAAVKGLLSGLAPKVYIEGTEPETDAKKLVTRTDVFDRSIAYVRIERVAAGLADALTQALSASLKTNKIQGIVLDLRFASGENFEAAAEAANLFVRGEKPLLNWGEGMRGSKPGDAMFTLPVAVLINTQTAGAAEALAAVLRDANAGLTFGSRSAGKAAIPREVKLSTGQVLRIGIRPLELGSGAKLSGKVEPDIQVDISEQHERLYFADAFAVISDTNSLATNGGTNRVSRRTRFSEADLVREHNLRARGEELAAQEKSPDGPVVNDPVLARAIDVLKGLAVVRQSKR